MTVCRGKATARRESATDDCCSAAVVNIIMAAGDDKKMPLMMRKSCWSRKSLVEKVSLMTADANLTELTT